MLWGHEVAQDKSPMTGFVNMSNKRVKFLDRLNNHQVLKEIILAVIPRDILAPSL
jgi:hypothetical protein